MECAKWKARLLIMHITNPCRPTCMGVLRCFPRPLCAVTWHDGLSIDFGNDPSIHLSSCGGNVMRMKSFISSFLVPCSNDAQATSGPVSFGLNQNVLGHSGGYSAQFSGGTLQSRYCNHLYHGLSIFILINFFLAVCMRRHIFMGKTLYASISALNALDLYCNANLCSDFVWAVPFLIFLI